VFERFTQAAREVVVHAQEEARDLRHGYIGTEHLLLALLREPSSVARRALDRLGVERAPVRSDVVNLVGEGPPNRLGGERDVEALRSIGIDLDEVRRRLEEAFGPGALERRDRVRHGWRRRKRCESIADHIPFTGHIPFTPRAKKALELSLREARHLGHGYIETEHILLGLVREREGLAARILAQRGASDQRVRNAVIDELARGGGLPGRSA
jgi:ATP-dependent Clp protease ATP-binding subunit ClpA